MLARTRKTRTFVSALVLVAAIGALAVSASALAGHGTSTQSGRVQSRYGAPDGWTTYAEELTRQSKAIVRDGRSPDTKDAALAVQARGETVIDGRSPDTRDAARTAQAQSSAVADGRSPDTRDFAALAHEPVVTITQASGFQWDDFGIGVGAAVGVMVAAFLSIRLLTGRHGRRQPDTVATA